MKHSTAQIIDLFEMYGFTRAATSFADWRQYDKMNMLIAIVTDEVPTLTDIFNVMAELQTQTA